MPIAAAGIMAGGFALGGMAGARSTSQSTTRSVKFQREMAKNKYQYLVNDLKAAGLNPILAAQSASAGPAGASAPVIPYMNPMGEAVQTGVDTYSTATQVQKMKQETKAISIGIDKMMEEMHLIAEHVSTEDYRQKLLRSEKELVDAQKGLTENNTEQAGLAIKGMVEELKQLKNVGEVSESEFGRIMTYVDRVARYIPGLGILLGTGGRRGQAPYSFRGGRPDRFERNPYKMIPR